MTLLNLLNNTLAKKGEQACSSAETGTAETVRYRTPRYRIHEAEGHFEVSVDLPGVDKQGVEIVAQDGVLEVTGQRTQNLDKAWKPIGGGQAAAFSYRLRLSIEGEVEEEGIGADLKNGALLLTLPKAEAKRPRRISVN